MEDKKEKSIIHQIDDPDVLLWVFGRSSNTGKQTRPYLHQNTHHFCFRF
jgi:hypothetical protein